LAPRAPLQVKLGLAGGGAVRKSRLIAIVGPTASGKSELALKVAQDFNGEIIAADSRTIYKGMDIGTAKPTKKEQELIPHWGIDLIEPGQFYNAYQFKKYAEAKIADIENRGKLPILVGGSGLYIDAVLFDFDFVETANNHQRLELEELNTEQLQKLIKKHGFELPENSQNRRHLIRTIEREGKIGNKRSLKNNTIVIGLNLPSSDLKKRIYSRAETYFASGLLQETKLLMNKYSVELLKKTHGIAYIATVGMLNNEITENEAIEIIQKREWQYARRQRTWFRRNKFIQWYESSELAYKEIARILNN
jgi:tRNA dimethylallyltransferase